MSLAFARAAATSTATAASSSHGATAPAAYERRRNAPSPTPQHHPRQTPNRLHPRAFASLASGIPHDPAGLQRTPLPQATRQPTQPARHAKPTTTSFTLSDTNSDVNTAINPHDIENDAAIRAIRVRLRFRWRRKGCASPQAASATCPSLACAAPTTASFAAAT